MVDAPSDVATLLDDRRVEPGKESITSFISDGNPTVRSWSAVNALGWAEGMARAELSAKRARAISGASRQRSLFGSSTLTD